jgi:hypothetical protein
MMTCINLHDFQLDTATYGGAISSVAAAAATVLLLGAIPFLTYRMLQKEKPTPVEEDQAEGGEDEIEPVQFPSSVPWL